MLHRKLYPALRYMSSQPDRACCIQPLQLTVARIGTDLGLFELLAQDASASFMVDELAKKTGADALLLSTQNPRALACNESLIHSIRAAPTIPCGGKHG